MGPKLKAIPQPIPLARLAYEKIRDSILEGHLKPGELYTEMNLARELGISRTPVREALLELSAQGLITFLPRKGIRVNYFTYRDIEEVFELRECIELAVVEKLASNAQVLDLSKAQRALESQRKAKDKNDSMKFLKDDRTFHLTLSKLTGNQRIVAIMENIRDMIQMMGFEALTRPRRMEEVINEHQDVLDFILKGEKVRARKAMKYHLDRSKMAVLEQHRPKV
jgi:DNA-binding GntR family transcriptional regulator